MERSAAFYYFASRLVEEEEERRKTREITYRAQQRNSENPLDVSDAEFMKRFRFTKDAFLFLCAELCEKTNIKSSKRVSVQLKVLCALSFYASGSYQKLVGMGQYFGQTTVSKFISEVTDALVTPSMMNSIIKFPLGRAQRDAIKNKYYAKYGFPGVIGCVDGCHFRICTPKKDVESLYYCRKNFHSLHVQMVCDSDCRILNINTNCGGATHKSFIWEYSAANDYMQELHRNNEQVWLLGDSGYSQRPWLMTPIPDAAEGSPEAKYNSVHGKARGSIENTLGRLKNRWRCISNASTLHYLPEKCGKIIMACSVLHNIALDFNLPDPEESTDNANYVPITSLSYISFDNTNVAALTRGRAIRSSIVARINKQL